MKEHGIIMSAPMVLALLAGRKTVTRRTSDRWAKVAAGDRLWVRETWSWRYTTDGDGIRITAAADGDYRYLYEIGKGAVSDWQLRNEHNERKTRPAIRMPRWASRIVLDVVSVTREPGQVPSWDAGAWPDLRWPSGTESLASGVVLPGVSQSDAQAEGIYRVPRPIGYPDDGWTWAPDAPIHRSPREAYLALFREINGDETPDHLWRIEFRRVG